MPRRRLTRLLRRAAAMVLVAFVALPELAEGIEPPPSKPTKSLDAMSPAELDAFVADLNHDANWRKARRPGDPPDFVPGQAVRVMHGAGSMLGRGGRGGGRSFRQSGLAKRRGGAIGGSRRGDRDSQSAMERGRGGSSSSSRSSRSGSGLGSSSRSSFGSSSSRSSFGSGFSNGMNE